MTAAIASTLRKTLVSAAIAAATVVVGTGTAYATVYEYSFSGLVYSATTNDAFGISSSGAYGFAVGSPITGRLWFNSDAQLTFSNEPMFSVYGAGMSGLTIDGLDLSGTPSSSAHNVINYGAGWQYDFLTYFANFDLPNGMLGMGWQIAAPTSWLSSTAMPAGLPISDLVLQHSVGSLGTTGYLGYGSQTLNFSFTSISPVPEPSTYGLMLAGLVLVGGIAARRRSDQGN